tara:strand:+ start:749 stop:1012 length:264 start_codon:yes stop_codon:yes gene_type:complete
MKVKEFIGYTGTILSVLSFLPLLINIYKTKKTNNFPYSTLILAILGNFLILLNGYFSKNNIVIFMGSIFVIIYLFIIFIKLMFKTKK